MYRKLNALRIASSNLYIPSLNPPNAPATTSIPMSLRPSFRASQLITRSYASAARPAARKPQSKSRNKNNPKPSPADSLPKLLPKIECEEYETFTLPDSRKLGFSTYAPPDTPRNAPTLLYFHGFPGSRIDARMFIPDSKTRVIGIDRPGIGLSTFQKNRRLLDWPEDVMHLARHLGIKTFRVIGASAGGPYALACAHAIPGDILKATGVVCGSAPIQATMKGLKPEYYDLNRRLVYSFRPAMKLRAWWGVGRKINSSNAAVKMKALKGMAADMGHHGELSQEIYAHLTEPFRQGISGYGMLTDMRDSSCFGRAQHFFRLPSLGFKAIIARQRLLC